MEDGPRTDLGVREARHLDADGRAGRVLAGVAPLRRGYV